MWYMAILCGGPADGTKWPLMEAVSELYWRVVSGEIPCIAEPSDPIEPRKHTDYVYVRVEKPHLVQTPETIFFDFSHEN